MPTTVVVAMTTRLPHHLSNDRAGFGVIEVVCAVLVTSIAVLGGASAFATARQDMSRTNVREAAGEAARRALEGAALDSSLEAHCRTLWVNHPGAWCTPFDGGATPYMRVTGRDASAKLAVRLDLRPIDDPEDGLGTTDSDQVLDDYFEIRAEASLEAGQAVIRRVLPKPVAITQRVDRLALEATGNVDIAICSIADIATAATLGRCSNSNLVSGGSVELERIDRQGGAHAVDTDGDGYARVDLPAGDWRVASASAPGLRYLRSTPARLRVETSGSVHADVLFTPQPTTARLCLRMTEPGTGEDGSRYVRASARVIHRVSGSEQFLATAFRGLRYDGWNCHELSDPLRVLDATDGLFQGWYSLAIENAAQKLTPTYIGTSETCAPQPGDLHVGSGISPLGQSVLGAWRQGSLPTTMYVCMDPQPEIELDWVKHGERAVCRRDVSDLDAQGDGPWTDVSINCKYGVVFTCVPDYPCEPGAIVDWHFPFDPTIIAMGSGNQCDGYWEHVRWVGGLAVSETTGATSGYEKFIEIIQPTDKWVTDPPGKFCVSMMPTMIRRDPGPDIPPLRDDESPLPTQCQAVSCRSGA
jgi:hypothetical protein